MASSWSRAVSGSTVTVGQGRKSVRPRDVLAADRLRHARRLRLDLRREGVGQAVLGHHDLEVDARVLEAAQHLEHAAGGVARGGGRPRDLGRDHLAGLRARVLARRDEQLVQHALVEGHHVAAEAAVLLVAAHDALQRALQDADDAALGALGRDALDARHHAVAVQRLLHVDGGDVDVVLPAAALLGHHEAVAGGVAGSRPTTRFMRAGRPTRAPRIFTISPSAIMRRRHGLQLARAPPARGAGGCIELPHGDGLPVTREQLEHAFTQGHSRSHECIRRLGRAVVSRWRRARVSDELGTPWKVVVPEVGLEPTLAEANTALNRARLPIPPLRQRNERRVYQRFPGAFKQRPASFRIYSRHHVLRRAATAHRAAAGPARHRRRAAPARRWCSASSASRGTSHRAAAVSA